MAIAAPTFGTTSGRTIKGLFGSAPVSSVFGLRDITHVRGFAQV